MKGGLSKLEMWYTGTSRHGRTWDFRDKDTWPDLFEWYEKNIQAFKAALKPIVSNF